MPPNTAEQLEAPLRSYPPQGGQGDAQETPPVIIVGAGPCGVRAANQLSAAGRDVVLFNAEAFAPYNRVKLTPLLAGDVQLGDISLALRAPGADEGAITCEYGLKIEKIAPEQNTVTDARGREWRYDKLILATGSSAFVPAIPGRDLSGVYSFRDANDVSALIARSFTARKVVVIGGGLLGLEAARGMKSRGAQVTVIEHENRLMPRQLDEQGADYLAERIIGMDVDVRLGVAVAEISGGARVEKVALRDGEEIPCDTVIICTGVRANLALAREAGLAVGRGVTTNAQMRSSNPNIYAVGECAEHEGVVYGLVGPGLEQADAAVDAIIGQNANYQGSAPATKLKVIGADVFSIGPVEKLEEDRNTRSHSWRDGEAYRRIFITRGKLSGAIGVGPWPEASRLQQAVTSKTTAYPWMVFRFRRHGRVWIEEEDNASEMPASAVVCNCTGVTCGRLRECIQEGARSVEALKEATGASSVCGTCQPVIEELLSAGGPPKPIRLFQAILAFSFIAAIGGLLLALSPRVALPDAYGASLMETLWFDNIVKQWSGYILLGITTAATLLGLRKRIRLLDRLGGYDWWRLVHLGVGVLAALGLFIHTGFRPGDNLNLALFIVFCAMLLMGAAAGLATGGDHKLREKGLSTRQAPARSTPIWAHILLLWPLPALLVAHILAVYAY